MSFRASVLLLGFCVLGCGSKGAVSLSAFIDGLQLSAQSGALGSTLTGSFTLRLELGEEASNATEVSLGNFSLAREGVILREPLNAEPEGATFPLSVGKGEERSLRFNIIESKVLTTAERDTLCQGGVVLSGAVTDTLSGGKTTPLASQAITPHCE